MSVSGNRHNFRTINDTVTVYNKGIVIPPGIFYLGHFSLHTCQNTVIGVGRISQVVYWHHLIVLVL